MPRFELRKHRVNVGERAAVVTLAVTMTIALALTAGLTAPRVLLNGETRDDATQHVVAEQLRYLIVVPADDSRAVTTAAALLRAQGDRAARPPALNAVLTAPSLATPPERVASGSDVDPRPRMSWVPAPVLPLRSHVATAPPLARFPGTETFTTEQQDSVLWKLERSVPYAPRLPPTPAQRDSMYREQARRWAEARAIGRPALPIISGGGITAPLFSSGPSAAQRRRDSAIHAGNVLRIQRLADRAKARLDSIRRMDSIALLTRP